MSSRGWYVRTTRLGDIIAKRGVICLVIVVFRAVIVVFRTVIVVGSGGISAVAQSGDIAEISVGRICGLRGGEGLSRPTSPAPKEERERERVR